MITWSYALLSDVAGADSSTDTGANEETSAVKYAELALDLDGDLPIQPYIVKGPDAVIQRLRVRFQFFKGEYFLDTQIGVPYRESILVKNPNPIVISFIFRRVLLGTPGVKSVSQFNAVLDKPNRALLVSFEAVLDDGAIIRSQSEPFIVG